MIYCIFKICYIISVLFLTRCHLSHNFIFLHTSNKLLINDVNMMVNAHHSRKGYWISHTVVCGDYL